MTSRRSWMLGLALGAAISVTSFSTAYAQVPRNFSYQGQLLQNGQAATGTFNITVNYYTAGGSTPIYTEVFQNASVQNGIFNLTLGTQGGFPTSMDFNEQYFIGVSIDGGAEMTPRTALLAAPYAINANSVNGFSVSENPAAGQLLVLDQNGMVPESALPVMQGPNFIAGSNISIAFDTVSNTYTFSSTGGSRTGITGVLPGAGLVGGGTGGEVTLALAPGAVTSEFIAPGAITGMALSPAIAGDGLYQDILGNLSVGVDNATITIQDDRLRVGMLGADNFDGSIQRRITGVAAPGSFITGINSNGTVETATIQTDSSLVTSLNGNNVFLRLNPANTNTFTAPQNFDVLNANVVNAQLLNAQTATIGDLSTTGNVMFGNGTNGNIMFNTGTGTIDFGGAPLTNLGAPVNGTDAITLDYFNNQLATQTFGGDITGTPGALEINTTNAGLGDRLITGINAGTTEIGNAAIADDLTINGGTINATNIGATTAGTGAFTTLSSTSQTTLATNDGAVVIGTATPQTNDALLEVSRAQNTELLVRVFNTGAAGSELRMIGGASATSTISFTDAVEYVSSINSSSGGGLTFNVRNTTEPNTDPTLEGAVAMRIERDRDVVIEEDLTVNGMATFNGGLTFGNGADNITFNSGTGVIDFGGATLTNLGAPVNNGDAVTLGYLNNQLGTQTFGGDITGTPGALEIDPTATGIGDRLISGVNAGTTTINDAIVADALTVDGGSINNTPIGATTASSGNFTTLNSTGQTQVATTSGNLVVGTASPLENDAIIQVQRAQFGDLLQRIYNTGSGGAELRLAGASGVNNTLSFTDDNEWLASVNGNDQTGLTFNVRDIAETNDEATLNTSVAMTIERDRDVVINEDLSVGGELIANSAPELGVSSRYSDTYVVPAPGGSTIVVPNTLVTPESTVIVSYEANTGTTPRGYTVQTDATGSFTVIFDAGITAGDEIHYIIINH